MKRSSPSELCARTMYLGAMHLFPTIYSRNPKKQRWLLPSTQNRILFGKITDFSPYSIAHAHGQLAIAKHWNLQAWRTRMTISNNQMDQIGLLCSVLPTSWHMHNRKSFPLSCFALQAPNIGIVALPAGRFTKLQKTWWLSTHSPTRPRRWQNQCLHTRKSHTGQGA